MTTLAHAPLDSTPPSSHGFVSRYARELAVGAAYVVILLLLAILNPTFFQHQFFTISVNSAPILIMAIGMTLVIVARHIDISIGSQLAVCAVLAGVMAKAGCPMPVVVIATILIGAALGAINGFLVAHLGLPSIVVTLATMVIFRESLRWVTQGQFINDLPDNFQWFGLSQLGGQWTLLITAGVVFLAFALVLRWIAAGRAVYAVGSDLEAARLAGIRPKRVVFWVFVLLGALVGLAAIVSGVRSPVVDPKIGEGVELTVIAAVVVGGTAISGGRGTLVGTMIGVALLATIAPALSFFGITPAWEKAVSGLIILVAVGLAPSATTSVRPAASASVPQRAILAAILLLELLIFTGLGAKFLNSPNLFEIARNCVELGLLALAMTLVIVTGGIDLSVGSLMSLCAVLLGLMQRDWHVAIWIAVAVTIGVALLAGGLNAVLITRLRMPPLIATLGTYSLFAGLAEGIAAPWKENPHDFPKSFQAISTGYLGPVPNQLIFLLLAGVAFFLLLHRAAIGRAISAIGYSGEGARHAGIPVNRRIALTYVLTGLCAGLAAVVAVARVNNAKADAGVGYELMAITAVVLGGTSIFGGRGSIVGTLMGVLAIVMLKNGLLMADRPDALKRLLADVFGTTLNKLLGGELAGILTGLLLLLSIAPQALKALFANSPRTIQSPPSEEFDMKNSQLAVLCIVILAAALIVTGGNYALLRSIIPGHAADASPKKVKIAVMPKSKGNGYFIAAQKGAEDCARELGFEMIWDGPTNTNPAEQSRIIDTWINRGVDVIAVACEDGKGISTSLRKAREKGIKVITWDSDADPDARDFFVNQATPEGIGYTLMDNAAKAMDGKGEFAIITASLNATNMNGWIVHIKARLAEKYPHITLVDIRPCDDQKDKAQSEAEILLNSRKDLKLIMAICSPAVPGAAEAVKQSNRKDVKVMGLGLPNDNKKYIKEGVTDDIVLWNTMDLGYLAVLASYDVVTGKLPPPPPQWTAGESGRSRSRERAFCWASRLRLRKRILISLIFRSGVAITDPGRVAMACAEIS